VVCLHSAYINVKMDKKRVSLCANPLILLVGLP